MFTDDSNARNYELADELSRASRIQFDRYYSIIFGKNGSAKNPFDSRIPPEPIVKMTLKREIP
jgi:hypothetical protein